MAKTLLKRGFYVKKAGAKIPTFMAIANEVLSRQLIFFCSSFSLRHRHLPTDFCPVSSS